MSAVLILGLLLLVNAEGLITNTQRVPRKLFMISPETVEVVQKVFEPQLSQDSATAFLVTGGVLVAATQVWWNSVIPQKRTELAKSKREGEVKEYIDGLREMETATIEEDGKGERSLERWLFADWIRTANKQRQNKPGALPFLKKAKWNSG